MNSKEIKLILINALFNFANALSTVFVNVYLYEYTSSLVAMSIYTAIRIGLFPFFFTIGGKMTRKVPFSLPISCGLSFIVLSLLFVLRQEELMAANSMYVYIVAILTGMGEGLYWYSINSCNQIVPRPEDRAPYLSYVGIFNNCTSLLAPIIAGVIIALSGDDTAGYFNIFKLVIGVYVLITLITVTLKIENRSSEPFHLWRCLSLKDRFWNKVLFSTFVYGIRDSLTLTLTGLMVYDATGGDGGTYSNLLAVFSVAAIICFRLMAKKMNNNNLFRFFYVGTFFIVTSTLVLVYINNLFAAVYFGFANAIGTAFYGNPYSYLMLEMTGKYSHENISGRVIAKETAMSLGRCFGMLLIVAMYYLIKEPYYLTVSVTFCSLCPLGVLWILKHRDDIPAK